MILFVSGALYLFSTVEKTTKTLPETGEGAAKTDQQTDQKEEEEYEPLIGAGYNVSTNANPPAATVTGYGPPIMNTNNRRYSDWDRGQNEGRLFNKDNENPSTHRSQQQQPRRRSPTTDDDRR